jgi:two-component system cell cycle sensor histidine kinase/response regulator CckA
MWTRTTQLQAMAPLVTHVREAVCLEDAQSRTALVNPAFCELFGLTRPDEGLLQTTTEVASAAAAAGCGHPDDWERRLAAVREAALPAAPETFSTASGATIDREYAPILVGGRLVGHYWRYRDTTRHAQLHETLRQSQRLTTVGRLAGGIAHDFNNLLTAVVGYCDLLDSQFDTGDHRRFDLHEIRNAAMRAASLTRQLLAFSRRQVMQPEVVDVTQMVTEMQKMLVRLMSEQVAVELDVPDEAADVFADQGQIEQVMFSLAVNARDAMPDGGTFAIRVRIETLTPAQSEPLQVKPGSFVHIEVADTGIGMDDETKVNALEPFFTTKDPGHRFGLGLGLPTAYGIVRQTGGAIAIDSAPGQGTTVHVYLPQYVAALVDDRHALVAPSEAPPAPALRDEPTVLVVEDESSVLKLVRRLLEAERYVVLSAQGGEEALLLAEQHTGPIDLLLTDVVMPGLNGIALAERFAQVRPETPVLFMSGYADAAVVQRQIIDAGRAFLQKPFAPDRLLGRVRDVLAAGG